MSIGSKIADLRKERKLTQKELAEKLNVSDKVVSRWETGVSLPDVEMMKKLSQALDVTIAQLYDALDEDDGNSDEKDNYERIWQYYDYERIWRYKRSTIICCGLFCIATLLAIVILVMVVESRSSSDWFSTLIAVLTVTDVVTVFVSVVWKVVSALSLSAFSKTKYYRTMYENALKKNVATYCILFFVCVAVVVVAWLLLALC